MFNRYAMMTSVNLNGPGEVAASRDQARNLSGGWDMLNTTPTPDFDRGLFYCPSATTAGTVYEASIAVSGPGPIRVTCTCPAGRHARHGTPVPCRHAKAVCALLEANGLAEQVDSLWVVTDRPVAA